MKCHTLCVKVPVCRYQESLNHLKTRNPRPGILTNSEDPDKMPYNAAFHQDLHCLLRQNPFSEKGIYFSGNYNLCLIDHSDLTLSNFMRNPIGTEKG